MKLHLSGWHNGIIGLENKVIDIVKGQIRPRATEQELHDYYDECVEKLQNHSEYFEEQQAFQETLEEAKIKKPKLIARNPVYPGFFRSKPYFESFERMFNPDKKIESKYFYNAQFRISIPLSEDSLFTEIIDSSSENITRISEEGIDKEEHRARIEIPNDRTPAETKFSTFHESLHYITFQYQIKSKRLFAKNVDGSKKERHIAENIIQEGVTDELTDLLLEDDKDALFESRWEFYQRRNPHQIPRMLISLAASVGTGLSIGKGIDNPAFLSFTPISIALGILAYNKYKNSKKQLLTQPIERKIFKI